MSAAGSANGGGSYYIDVISPLAAPLGNLERRSVGDEAPVVLDASVVRGEVALSVGYAGPDCRVKTAHIPLTNAETARLVARLLSCLADTDPELCVAVVRIAAGAEHAST